MNYIPTMGSLFSGIGGFEVAAEWHGVKCLWQSEIEPWAVCLLKKRFPDVRQLGSVCDINGAEIEPVDIITFGSPGHECCGEKSRTCRGTVGIVYGSNKNYTRNEGSD